MTSNILQISKKTPIIYFIDLWCLYVRCTIWYRTTATIVESKQERQWKNSVRGGHEAKWWKLICSKCNLFWFELFEPNANPKIKIIRIIKFVSFNRRISRNTHFLVGLHKVQYIHRYMYIVCKFHKPYNCEYIAHLIYTHTFDSVLYYSIDCVVCMPWTLDDIIFVMRLLIAYILWPNCLSYYRDNKNWYFFSFSIQFLCSLFFVFISFLDFVIVFSKKETFFLCNMISTRVLFTL